MVVVSCSGAVTVMLRACDEVAALAPRTCNVKLNVPAAVGVPVIAPVVVLRVNPRGKAPLVIDHV